MEIDLPALEEQRRIAAILDKADTIRTKRRQALAHVIGLPLSLFRSYKKETWPLVPLSELVLDHQIGLDRKASAQGPDREHEYVKMNAITRDGGLQLDSITRIDATPAEVEKFSLTEGDLILNTRNSRELVGKSAVYRGPSRVYNNNIMRIRFHEQATALVVHAYFWTREGRQALERIKSGTTNVFAVYAKDLLKLRVPLVDDVTKAKYTAYTQKLEGIKHKINSAIEVDEALFASLQSRAFKGEL